MMIGDAETTEADETNDAMIAEEMTATTVEEEMTAKTAGADHQEEIEIKVVTQGTI